MFYLVTKSGLTVTFPGSKTFNVAKDHKNFDKVLELVKSDKATVEDLDKLVNLRAEIAKLDADGVMVTFNDMGQLEVTIGQEKVSILSVELQERLIEMINEDDDELRKTAYSAFAKFLKNLYKNPSYKSVEQLYGFLEANDLPITQNGTFLAYKKVEADYFDIHSHTFDNSIGKSVSMPRYQVEDNPEKTCSSGLHVCSYGYLDHYASTALDRVVICEVNPKDVVSIPTDYNNAKMRVCEYKVVDEVPTYFDAQLSSYVFGNHEDGWISKTFEKMSALYKDFFKAERLHFADLPNTVETTPAVVAAFWESAKEALEGLDIPQKMIDISTEKEEIPTMKIMLQWLSKYDSKWVHTNNN